MTGQSRDNPILVVGGGLVGLFSAFYLRKAGHAVSVYDRGALAREASWAGGGILWPLRPWNEPDELWHHARRGAGLYRAFANQGAAKALQWHACGMRVLDPEAHAMAWCQQHAVSARIDEVGALVAPDVAQVRTPRIGAWLVQQLQQMGVSLRPHCEISRIEADEGGVDVAIDQGPAERWSHVVLAAGAWTGQVAQLAGQEVPVQPVRGHMVALSAGTTRPISILQCGDRYVITREDGLAVVGSTLENVGFDRTLDDACVDGLVKDGQALGEGLTDARLEAAWTGFRPRLPGDQLWIGPIGSSGRLWVNTGHYRSGVTMAPASGELLASRIAGTGPDLLQGTFQPPVGGSA